VINELSNETELMLKKGQKFHLHFDAGHLEIQTDKNILRNILYNLVSNAIKYSDEDKSIYCDINVHLQNVIIQIRDEGVGIPEVDQKHIGSRFFQGIQCRQHPGHRARIEYRDSLSACT
jgi:signal transduction histidine kinase